MHERRLDERGLHERRLNDIGLGGRRLNDIGLGGRGLDGYLESDLCIPLTSVGSASLYSAMQSSAENGMASAVTYMSLEKYAALRYFICCSDSAQES